WAVMFRTSTVMTLIDRELAPQVFSLPPDAAVVDSAFIVLTSAGRGLAGRDGATAWHNGTVPTGGSLAERWADRLALMPEIAAADCVGIGALPGEPPVVLALRVEDGIAAAEAIFEKAPEERNYDLLAAAGVRYRGGAPAGPHWRARFTNDLPQHLLAAALSGFARTGHCNRFFLQHGVLDAPLAGPRRRREGAHRRGAAPHADTGAAPGAGGAAVFAGHDLPATRARHRLRLWRCRAARIPAGGARAVRDRR